MTTEAARQLPRLSLRDRARPGRAAGPPIALGRRTAWVALTALILATLAVVAYATSGPTILVPRSARVFPTWEAGPLHLITPRPLTDPWALDVIFSLVLAVMVIAYGVAMLAIRSLTMRALVIVILVLHAILLLSPPLQLSDIFNYLGYARLGALHGLSPYTHGISAEHFDPIFQFASWDDLHSPYGELFTALSYPLAFLPLPISFWIIKVAIVALSLLFLWLVWWCAVKLGRDPRFVVGFVVLNPIYLIYAIAGFHNDFLMLDASMAAIAFVLSGRDRAAGAAFVVAVAVKFTVILLGPFLLIGVGTRRRSKELVIGGLIAAIPLAAMSIALFGTDLPNLQQQSSLLTELSVPNLVGLLLGVGGATSTVLDAADLFVLAVVLYFFFRRRDWLAGAGWSTLALLVGLAWLVPWYVVWVLPLAALGSSPWLRRATALMTIFLVATFAPAVTTYLANHNINPLDTPAGRASQRLQNKLAS
jgi:glycosyl transferase family 87